MRDEIIDQVRATREAFAAKFNFDVMAMVRDLRERELASGRVILPIPPGLSESKAAEPEAPTLPPRNVAA